MAEGLVNRGYRVDLVLGKKQGEYLEQVPAKVNLIDLRVKKLLLSLNLVGAYLKKQKPAVLISANERVNIVALLAKKIYRSKTKLIISVHVNNTEQMARQGASIYRKIIIRLARWTYKWADSVVAVSEGVAADVAALFSVPPEKIHVIYNPIINSNLGDKINEPVEHPWFKQEKCPVVIGVGRLNRQKDFLTLIKSLREIKKVIADTKLIILGEGQQRRELENEIKMLRLEKDVYMPGFVENPYSYLKNSSVFVLSSAWEGFGNVLVEAMATGTPVVSTDCPSGPAEILKNGKYGPLVPVGDANSLAREVVAILKDPPAAELLIRRAHDFTVDKAVDHYISMIDNF